MVDRDAELPLATMRPRRLRGQLTAARGTLARWLRGRLGGAGRGRNAVFLLTGIFFAGTMLCMGYVAGRARRAASAIDEAQRAARELGQDAAQPAARRLDHGQAVPSHAPTGAVRRPARDQVLFYIGGGARR